MMNASSIRVSVLILTLNEEVNLPRCLDSLKWCDDVVVLDSFSTDRTEGIAQKVGVRFYQRKFDDYATHRNYGLNEISYKHPWVLMVDADEMVPPPLVDEMKKIVAESDENMCLYHFRRKDFFLGRWIKRSSGYPTWFGRLVRVGHVRVQRAINEEYHTDGKMGYLTEHFHHYPFNKGFHSWFEKHNRYSTMEAEFFSERMGDRINWGQFIDRDPVLRRKAVKSLAYHLPGRPLLMFFALYIVRRGFLDGRAGLTYSLLRAFYEYMIDCKIREIKRREIGSPV